MIPEETGGAEPAAGNDTVPEPADAVRSSAGADRRDLLPRLRRDVDAELARVRETIRTLEEDRIGAAGYLALLIAIGVNVWGYLTYENGYMLLWIVSSLYFFGFYWLVPMVAGTVQGMLKRKKPAGEVRPAGPKPDPKQLIGDVKEANLLRFKNRLIAVGWNVWFLGAVSMTAGYLFIFSVDILYAVLLGFVFRGLTILTVALVISQSIGIILYYLVVFYLRPYSSDFSAWLASLLQGRKERKAQGKSSVGPTAVLGGVIFVLLALMLLTMFFPDIPLSSFISVSELRPVRFHFFLGVMLISQLVIMQVWHRWLSIRMTRPILAASEQSLAREGRALRLQTRTLSPRRRRRRIDRAISLLAEAKLYRVRPVRPIGLFTLFLLGSDFMAVLSLRDVRRMDPRLRIPGRKRRKTDAVAAGTPPAEPARETPGQAAAAR
jgi:hypothetical protein